jgi:hypothetical protein
MSTTQSVIKIPEQLAHALDRLAEARHKRRTAYVVDILWQDVRRNRQREAIRFSSGAWKSKDHPELAGGGAAYVEKIRSEEDQRFEKAVKRRKR